ncbi:unnamed protein product [Phytophthora lilii]|uniref:Unnamed protein product n=1 Tax=Phytophthora lilii TaxID=2077276 RepID=A0A9W6TKW7_9STRA|nr:unnamed protein product [Phytophthora lilii]
MDNTKAEAVRGLLGWGGNDIHFRKTQLDRDMELVDENWSLETLYQKKLDVNKIARVIELKARSRFEWSNDTLVAQICRRAVEEEVQQLEEVEVATLTPANEKAWDYSKPFMLHLSSISAVP